MNNYNSHHNIKFALATESVLISFQNNGVQNETNAFQDSLPYSSRLQRQDPDLPTRQDGGSEVLFVPSFSKTTVFKTTF